jgi:hypothetical protein
MPKVTQGNLLAGKVRLGGDGELYYYDTRRSLWLSVATTTLLASRITPTAGSGFCYVDTNQSTNSFGHYHGRDARIVGVNFNCQTAIPLAATLRLVVGATTRNIISLAGLTQRASDYTINVQIGASETFGIDITNSSNKFNAQLYVKQEMP